jgi:hypothetical protein
MIRMRTMRRFSHYFVGEMIAVPPEAARDLAAKRLAQPIDMLVPVVAAAEDGTSPPSSPQRQPAGIVRK